MHPRLFNQGFRFWLLAIAAGAWNVCESAHAQSLLANGTFEAGRDEIPGWHAGPGGTIQTATAHRGQRSLAGHSRDGAAVWESDRVSLRPGHDYRLEGWIRGAAGTARLRVDLADQTGRALASAQTPASGRSEWRYVAVDWNSGNASAGRVSFWVKGKAELDDVALSLIETSYMGNKSVEADARGRIPFWNEERTDTLLPGRRAGEIKPDADVRREGKFSVRLAPTADWIGFASVNYPVPPWTDRLELSGWARCALSASAQILACWTDDSQNVLRVDTSASVKGNDWQPIQLTPQTAPATATGVRLVAVARGGQVWFDDFELLRLRPTEERVRIFVNQVGCELAGPKSAVLASNFFPRDTDTIQFELVSLKSPPSSPASKLSTTDDSNERQLATMTKGRVALSQTTHCAGRVHGGESDDWGWYFWRADFSKFRKPGAYRVVVKLGGTTAESAPFQIGRSLVLTETARKAVDFFYIQRCGFEVPGWHKACHLDDAKLPDGAHLDATGGWHSAGDYNKLMYEHGDGGVVFALLTAFESAPAVFGHWDRDADGVADAFAEAKWGAAFVAKMQIPETGALRNHVNQGPGRNWTKWSAPEVHTDNKPGTEDDPIILAGEGNSPLVIGGWAQLSALLKTEGKTERRHSATAANRLEKSSTEDYLAKAHRLWKHATKDGQEAGSPYLLISTIDLHHVTGETAYLDYVRRAVDKLLSQQTTRGPLQGAFGSYGETSAAALAQFALAFPKDERVKRIKHALGEYITFSVGSADNAFGLSPQTVGGTNTFFPADLGNNFQILTRAWAAALVYRATRDSRALRYAQDHLDWVLGKNPINLCMFEGLGTQNPPRYHHRYNSIPGHERWAVPGTVPNGFVRDMGLADRPGFDLSRTGGRAPSYRTSEPWLVHNMFYLLAASALERALRE